MKAWEAYMRCRVAPGLFFPEEYAIEIPMGGDTVAAAWVWKSNVIGLTGEVKRQNQNLSDAEIVALLQGAAPNPDPNAAQGWARVLVMDEAPDDRLWVTLPYDTFNGSQTFNVSRELVVSRERVPDSPV